MKQEKLWAVFQETGKVEDYLRYCGIDIYTTGANSAAEEHNGEPANENHHRRSHREREQ